MGSSPRLPSPATGVSIAILGAVRRIVAAIGALLVVAGLTACSPEQRPPGYLDVVPGLAFPSVDQEVTDASVVLPHLAYEFTSMEVTDTIEQGTARAFALGQDPFASASGEEFVLARLDRETPTHAGTGDLTVTLLAGAVEHDLTEELTARTAQDRILLLVSVPEGSAVHLEFTEGSQTTTLDLRAGSSAETP